MCFILIATISSNNKLLKLYDPAGLSAARLHTKLHGLRPRNCATRAAACMLELSPLISMESFACDRVLVSFFAYRACRDLHILLTGWWHAEQGDLSSVRVKIRERKRTKIGRKWEGISTDEDLIEEAIPLMKASYPFAMHGSGRLNSRV